MADNIMTVDELKTQFDAWQVPSEEHFHALINLAALTFKPGLGLSGGDPSMNADVIDVGQVTPLQVKAHDGITAAAEGIAVLADPAGGLEVKGGSLTLKPSSGVMSEGEGLSLRVNAGKALKVGESVAVQIKTNAGLTCDESTGVSLQADNTTVTIDDNNRLRVKCLKLGGLTIDPQGCLTVDLETILAPPCIQVFQGDVHVCLPQKMMTADDKCNIYINDMYVGEVYGNGIGYSVTEASGPSGYISKGLQQWVTERDSIQVRLIKAGQDEAKGEVVALHVVTSTESAPATIVRVTGITIVNAGGTALTTVSEGEVMTVKHDQVADGFHYRWKIYNASAKAWNNFPNNTQASLTVPGDFMPGSRLCVLVQPHEEKGPLALSQIVTVKSK
ncbi:hypothetical protein [Serratia bockelmannii]|uniref:hypothetical protein n=1 Tax=Serratia bockelmannii TaxID=2703793 RepID=UPI003FA7EB18